MFYLNHIGHKPGRSQENITPYTATNIVPVNAIRSPIRNNQAHSLKYKVKNTAHQIKRSFACT